VRLEAVILGHMANLGRARGLMHALHDPKRRSSIDIFRSFAILAVVLFHAELLDYGYLGVDLFFVISGFLVSAALLSGLRSGEPIDVPRFLLTRGFKIWPSYYGFLLIGTCAGALLYGQTHPEQLIPLKDWPRYLFFYRNYRGGSHWSFDHIWSLCVEEHFYLILPLIFVLSRRLAGSSIATLTKLVSLLVLTGIVAKVAGYFIHFETHAATHNRIDALAWGVLLSIVVNEHKLKIESVVARGALFFGAWGLFAVSLYVHRLGTHLFFNEVVFHSITPPLFFVMMLALMDVDFSRLLPLRIIAYYSYNWYLWHAILVLYLKDKIASTGLRTAVYMLLSFGLAVLFTRLLEEPSLEARSAWIERLLGKKAALKSRLLRA
jgi:peptidoglycan/LPS O-acetylase OafA/YrhL